MNVSRPGPFSVLMWLLFSLLFSLAAHANNFSILIDQDRNTATGCSVPLAGGAAPVTGAEVRLDVVVDSTAPVTVTTVRRALCDAATETFSTPTTLPADVPVGLNLGVDASDVVEFDAPLTDLGLTPGDSVTLTVTSTTGQTGSVQATVTDLAIPGGTPPAVPANIPTLSDLGLVVMMALLAIVLWRQRQRSGWVAAVALLALPLLVLAVNHVSDGLIGDWAGETPIATHPAGQAPTPRTDVRQVFIAQENGQFFVRLDVTELERTPPALTVRASGPSRIVEGHTASLQATVANANGAVTYRWQPISGAPVTLSNPSAANPTFIAPATTTPLPLTFEVTATDTVKAVTDQVDTVVQPDGIFVDAGTDRTVPPGVTVTLHANGQGDGPGPNTYAWRQVSPASPQVALTGANTANPSFTAPPHGADPTVHDPLDLAVTLVFEVTFSDGLKTASDRVQVVREGRVQPAQPGSPLIVIGPAQQQPLVVVAPPSRDIAVPATGKTEPINAVASGGDQHYVWRWRVKGKAGPGPALKDSDLINANGPTVTVPLPAVPGPTTYAFTAEVRDQGGAGTVIAHDSISLFAYPADLIAPNPLSVYGLPVTVDEGALAPLTALASGGTSPYTYQWRQVSGVPVVLEDPDTAHAHFTAPATDSNLRLEFAVTVTDAAGATADATVEVTVNDTAMPSLQPLALTAPPPATALSGVTINLVANATGGDRAYTWQWTQTTGPSATLSGTDTARLTATLPTVTARQTLSFHVTVTDGAGAQRQATTPVTVDPVATQAPNPLGVYGPPVTVNEGALAPLSVVASGGQSPYTYAWRQTGGTPTVTLTDATDATAHFTAPATDSRLQLEFTVTVTDAAGTTADATVTVTVNDIAAPSLQPLTLTVPPPATALGGTTLNLVANATGGDHAYTWQWTQTSGPAATLSGTDTARLTATLPTVTARQTLTFQVTVTDGTGAQRQATTTVTVDPTPGQTPLSVYSPPVTVNEGALAPLAAIASGGTSPYRYAWRQTGGSPSVTLADATAATAHFTAPATDSTLQLTFAVTATDATGATADATVTVTINDIAAPSLQPLALTVPPPATALSGTTLNLVANATGGDRNYTWQWTQTSGPAATLSGDTTARLTATLPTVTTRQTLTFQVTVTDGTGATQPGTVTVTLDPTPTQAPNPLSVYGPPVTVNEGELAPLAVVASGGTSPYTYAWRQTGGNPTVTLTDATTATAHFTAPATDSRLQLTFVVTVIDTTGATADTTLDVTVNDVATPSLQPLALTVPPPATALSGTTLNLVANATGGDRAYTWQWTQTGGTAATLSGGTTARLAVTLPTITTAETLSFQVTVTDGAGSTQQGTTTVNVTLAPVQSPLDVYAPPLAASEGPIPVTISAQGQGGTGPYTYAWTQTAGPTVTLAFPDTPDQARAVFQPPAVDKDETLTFEVTVTDSTSATFTKAMNVLIRNAFAITPPQVLRLQPLPAQTEVLGGHSVQLTASATGGTPPYTWAWQQTGGTTASLSGQTTDILTVTPLASAPAETLTFQVTVTDSAAASTTGTAPVTVLATPSTAPLTVAPTPTQYVDEGADTTLSASAQGGTGNYQYQWTFVGSASGSAITTLPLTDANTPVVRFTAPSVSAMTLLNFEVTVNDGANTVTQNVAVTVNDLTPPLELNLANTNPLTVHSGDTVALTPGTARGGQGPYTYQWTQRSPATPVVTLTGADTTNPSFTAPTVTQATVLVLVMTVTDALGNTVDVTESVTVQPAIAPLTATLSGPDSLTSGVAAASVHFQSSAIGGVPPYTASYQSSYAGLALPTGSEVKADFGFDVPAVTSNTPVTLTLQVTDSATPPVTATATHAWTITPAVASSSPANQCMVCGDYDGHTPCDDFELFVADMTPCPSGKSYCMNDIVQRGLSVQQFRRCVDLPTCDNLYYNATSDKPLCMSFDPTKPQVQLDCHLCCLGDQCNLNVNPPANLLYRP